MKTIVVYRINEEDADMPVTILGVALSKKAALTLAGNDIDAKIADDDMLPRTEGITYADLSGEGYFGDFNDVSWHVEEHDTVE